jgi:hypothetical protein
MDTFYIIVLTVATIILILILTFIGLQISNKKNSTATFPPLANLCPDYWNVSSDGKSCLVPSSGKNAPNKDVSTASGYSKTDINKNAIAPQIDFTNAGWTSGGNSATCAQKKWANTNGIMWDGVTNYNRCP